MKIILDENAGFCFGVKNAVRRTFDEIDANRDNKIFTYGPLIHNNQVINRLKDKGVYEIQDIDQLKDNNARIIIRSHGVAEDKYREFEEKGIRYIDCTCPYVAAIHKKVKEYYDKGYKIFIVGDKNHPEVIGTNGWCNYTAHIIDSEKIVDKLPIYDKICLVAQTTITKKLWDSVVDAIEKKYENAVIFNTICSATEERQKSTEELSKNVDCMIVIGSRESSNTNKLFQISSSYCKNTYHLETAEELPPPEELKKFDTIGITAGASTPDWVIKEVISKMSDINENTMENQSDLMEEYEKTMKSVYSGDKITGTVIMVNEDEVMVNIGYKSDGIIKKEDFTWDPDVNLKDMIKVGDQIEVIVVSINDGEGNVVLSKKLVDAENNWNTLEDAYKEKTPVEGLVKELVKGGAIVEILGIRAFMHASQFDLKYAEELSVYLNTKVKVNIIEYNEEKRKIIVSRKELLKKEKEALEKEVWEKIEAGQRLSGEVKRLTDFGAFVDIGGVDGLIHVSELSWTRVKHPSDVVKPGDKVEVIVLAVDKEKKKISLGLKQTLPEPWSTVEGKYKIGDIVEVKVLRFSNFGVFVELIPCVDGLIHISQISDKRIAKPADALNIGDVVKAKIIDMKLDEKKISLSIKEAQEVQETPENSEADEIKETEE